MAELIDRLRANQVITIVELGGLLLRFCSDNSGEYLALRGDAQNYLPFKEARADAVDYFQNGLGDEELDLNDLQELRNRVAAWLGRLPQVLVARAFAEGLDESLGCRFRGCFRGRRVHVSPRDPCPTSVPPLKEIFESLNTHPDRASEPIDRVENLCLAPANLDFDVYLDFTSDDALALFKSGTKIAVGLPGDPRLEFDRFTLDGKPLFYNARPLSRCHNDFISIFRKAQELGVDILIFPEVSTDEEGFQALRSEVNAGAIPLVVAGSRHVPVPALSPGSNEAVLFVRGREGLVHRKLRPFQFPDDSSDSGEPASPPVDRHEHLAPQRELVIYFSAGWSIAVLICKDLLEIGIVRVLEDLRTRLILVPACSPKTDGLESKARQLSENAQATVLVANMTERHDALSKILVTPRRDQPTRVQALSGAPALVITELGTGDVSIVDVLLSESKTS